VRVDQERLAHGRDDARGDVLRTRDVVEVLADDDELVAGEARERVARSQDVAQAIRDRHEEEVARAVPERVVDRLEVVEVEEQHAGDAPGAAPRGDRLLETVVEQHPVRQPRQRVVQEAMAQLILGALGLGARAGVAHVNRGHVGEDLSRHAVLRAEAARRVGVDVERAHARPLAAEREREHGGHPRVRGPRGETARTGHRWRGR
jgi:hypothetical protein